MKRISVFGLLFCLLGNLFLSLASAGTVAKDMVLIYSGGSHRWTWNKEHFLPYVSVKDNDSIRHWLFDGFLFLEIKNGEGRGFASYYEKDGCRKKEWKKLLDDYFTTGQNLCALEDCIEEAKANIVGPFSKRKIVIGIPEPIPGQNDWGTVDGMSELDFSNSTDRLKACCWFIDYAISKFNDSQFDNLELSGFYWIAEEATNSRDLAANVGDYVRSKCLNFNWIPYFRSDGFREWKKLGFDIAYFQPNYFFDEKIQPSRLDSACIIGNENGMCMEMEFDERVLKKNGRGYRLTDYINAFDRYGIFSYLPIAYYQGSKAWYDLYYSEEAEDRRLFYELAERIVRRAGKHINFSSQ